MSYFAQTFSKFIYGFSVTADNNSIDVDEGSGEFTASIDPGNYSFGDFTDAIALALNTSGVNTYTVTADRSTRKFTIAVTAATTFKFGTGAHAGSSAATMMGFNDTDETSVTSLTSDNSTGTVYSPQFMLQSYVPSINNEGQLFSTKNESATGRVQVQSFGQLNVMMCEIVYATNITQASGGPIRSSATGIDDLRSFMSALCLQVPVEFYVDEDDDETFETMILDSTPESKDGTAFQLKEMQSWILRGYFQTGALSFRVIT